MSEIYEIFQIEPITYYEKSLFEKILEIIYNIFGIITIIPISIVFISIRKCSISLYNLFHIASLFEMTIIIYRLILSFCNNYNGYSREFLIGDFFDVKLNIINNITYRERFCIALPTLTFLTILNINTHLCRTRIDQEFILQIYGSENKQVLLQEIKAFFKKVFKKFLKFSGVKSESDDYLRKLGVNAWKFVPKSRILQLNIVQVIITPRVDNDENDEIENVDNKKDEDIVSDENDKNVEIVVENDNNNNGDTIVGVENNKNNKIAGVKNGRNDLSNIIIFNAKSDVMIQTNYPLLNINDIPLDTTIFLNMNTTISSQLSSPLPPEEYWFLSPSSQIKYWFYYYEITILLNPNNDKTIIAIGLAPKNFSTNRLPGCNTHSVGFHSDEGRVFRNEKYTGSKYAGKWGKVNDVIGCGYCPNTGQVFFTINGKNLGIAYNGLFYNWYPTIGSNGFCKLKVNFGQREFKYKEANGMGVAGIISQELL